MRTILHYLKIAAAAVVVAFCAFAVVGILCSENFLGHVVMLVAIGSLAAAVLIIIETIRDRKSRFSLSTLMLVFALFALALGAIGVLIHSPGLVTGHT